MARDEVRQESLTVYLAKPGLEGVNDTIKLPERLAQFPIADDTGSLGTLYVERRGANPPRWGRFFVPQVEIAELGRASSTSALLHVLIDDRAMLLTFGQGRHLMKSNCWEDRFGLRVALNSIGANRLRSIDKSTLDTVGLHSRVQVSKEAAPSEFGIDVERDLLRAITGTPEDPTLGNTLSGLDSLHISVRVTPETLRPLLSRYLAQFERETFKEKFPWVDYIRDVKDPALKNQLDALMLEAVLARNLDKCWLAVPDPIEWAGISGFRYGRGRKHTIYHDIDLVTFLESTGIAAESLTIDYLEKHDACAIDGDDSIRYNWPIYKCVYCEIDQSGETYLLSGGRWYKVASDFVAQVNEYYENLTKLDTDLPEYNDESEGAYNERVATENPEHYALMDRKLISIGGGYSKVEFCDLLSHENDLIHVKRYGGSGVLSHLFLQGIVSGQSFASDTNFREAVNAHLPDEFKLQDIEARPDPASYRVVYAIISSEEGDNLTLPFFSRLSVRHAMQTLQGYGYNVALTKIHVADARSKIKKIAAKRKR